MVQIKFTLTEEAKRALEELARADERSMSAVVRRLILAEYRRVQAEDGGR